MTTDDRIDSFPDEKVGSIFIYLGEDTRQCVTCCRIFSRRDSYEHSKTICFLPVSTMN